MPDDSHELTLYVQSKKAVTTFFRPSTPSPNASPESTIANTGRTAPVGSSSGDATSLGDHPVFFLSDDQARCQAMVEEIATQRGYLVKVVDVEKVSRLERLVTEHLRGVQKFPVLISPLGRRLEGVESFTEEELASIMPADLKSVRAFTYLKVRGGDLDKIKRLLETFVEVKELHFLTGDWDILVVLDFPPSSANKRRVLDFVTERIRGIPEVLDTSTIVPEYSLTKFPIS
ncbi:MAG TPA: Lrp/AsnC ligand binding domain-containing protein [Thermoplasmata archaeon]|nr:Lrp/AsnC ligand binding domain-containing protein [Thermoplasmata archaeon]